MKRSRWFLLLGLGLATVLFAPFPQRAFAETEASPERSPRFLAHLLDYLAVDYAGAVRNGKILVVSEYKEQIEFVRTADELSRSLPETKTSPELLSLMGELDRSIRGKADPAQVGTLARRAQAKVVELAKLKVAPPSWPSLDSGRKLFTANCAKCHGDTGKGDGPSAAALEPRPVNMQDHARMDKLAPFQVFNAVRLGVPNTPMAAFTTLSDQETWALSFYVLSLRYPTSMLPPEPGLAFQQARSDLGLSEARLLETMAVTPDETLEKGLAGAPSRRSVLLASLRLHSTEENAQASLDFARFSLLDSQTDYLAGRFKQSAQKALRAYVDGVEPVEPRLRANDPRATSELEQLMGEVRSSINGRRDADQVRSAVRNAMTALDQAGRSLRAQAPSPGLTFTLAFGILLREGFEAVLLIVALLGVIGASGAVKAKRWVHGGWIAAVALGVLAWFFSGWLMNISGLGRELMEALTGLLTVAILLYIGFWLHSRTEVHRWKNFIEVQVKAAVDERNLIQLAFISFLAAFREAVETVLFLRAIWLEGGSDTRLALGMGLLCAFAAILVLGWLLLTFSARVPVKALFNVSSVIMVVLAVILIGKAVHSFQEIDYLPITLSPLNLHWDWLGLYPTWETLLAQFAVLALSLFLWIYGKKAPKNN